MTPIDLSEREAAILRGLADGLTLTQIASELRRSRATIEPAYRRLLSRVGARNDAHAVGLGHRLGLLGTPRPAAAQPAYAPPVPPRRTLDPPAVTARRRAVLAVALRHRPRGPACLADDESAEGLP